MAARGRLIALEGGEAVGKSTQARLLGAVLGALVARQPGGTPLGAQLRSLLLDPENGPVNPRAEALMMLADRAQHIADVVAPALDSGQHVVLDRFNGSTLAYQGFGRGLDVTQLERLCRWSTDGVRADLNVLLDIDPAVAAERRDETPDRIEAADLDFHQRVREGFLGVARADPDRWVVIDASGSMGEVRDLVRSGVADRLGLELVAP